MLAGRYESVFANLRASLEIKREKMGECALYLTTEEVLRHAEMFSEKNVLLVFCISELRTGFPSPSGCQPPNSWLCRAESFAGRAVLAASYLELHK